MKIAVLAVAILMAIIPTLVLAQGDLTPPTLANLQIDPPTVDTSLSAQVITFTARITDDLSGVKYVVILFAPAVGGTQRNSVFFQTQNRISGTELDGIYRNTMILPRYAAQGRWAPVQIEAGDNVGNICYTNAPCPFEWSSYYFINGKDNVTPTIASSIYLPVIFRPKVEPPPANDPCATIGGDGCKWHVRSGPKFGSNDGTEIKLQLFFENSAIDGGEPQGSYFVVLMKNGAKLPIEANIRSIALEQNQGALGSYNYEYKLGLDQIPDHKVAGNYTMWVLDGNGVRDSHDLNFTIPSGQGVVWIDWDAPQPSPEPQYEFNKAILQRCDPNAGVTYVEGTTYRNGQPESGHLVTFSYAPDGPRVATVESGPHLGYPGWRPGFYSHILQTNGHAKGTGISGLWTIAASASPRSPMSTPMG